MSAISRFEGLVERIMEGGLTKLLRDQLHPAELAKKLGRAMEDGQRVGVGKVYVPNDYTVQLSPEDFGTYEPYRASFEREFAQYLVELARERHFTLPSRPIVRLLADDSVPKRQVRVATHLVEPGKISVSSLDETLSGHTARLDLLSLDSAQIQQAWLSYEAGGMEPERVLIDHLPYTLGRALDNDLVLEDRRVSRHHAQIKEIRRRLYVFDLESTNGTFVNRTRVKECVLNDGDVLSLGGCELTFRLRGGR
jgi:hypothetical protein